MLYIWTQLLFLGKIVFWGSLWVGVMVIVGIVFFIIALAVAEVALRLIEKFEISANKDPSGVGKAT